MLNRGRWLQLVTLGIVVAACGGRNTSAPVAQTDSGLVEGRVLASGVQTWLGIPFAAPPVGDRRWREAAPLSWAGTWHADRKMPECIQVLRPHDINHYFGEEATSEDCLYMNIWAPPDATPSSRLPVIVFIYGGGGTIGSSGMANYAGDVVASRGAVFVNFNYRVGILGYMAHPELTAEQGGHSGNYGYLDQHTALDWIHRNIAAFGGDPDRVVVTGQSAGARSVVQQIFSPLSQGLFRGGVMFSGCTYTGANTPLADAEAVGLEIQDALDATNLHDMRQVPADQILAVQNESQLGRRVTGFRTGGVIDGYFMPDSLDAILEAGGAADVPIIASFTHDEANSPLKAATSAADYRRIAHDTYGPAAEEFLRLYPVAGDGAVAMTAQAAANDAAGLQSARTCAALQAAHHTSPTFITVFSRRHPYTPGVEIADQDPATIGAYHTSEIPYYFGTFDAYNLFRPTRNWTPSDYELSETLTAALIAFARTGSPSTDETPWPAWSDDDERYLDVGDEIATRQIDAERIAFMESHRAAPGGRRGGRGGFPRD